MKADVNAPIQYCKGVGPALVQRFGQLGIVTIHDLLWHIPARYIDRRQMAPTGRLQPGPESAVIGIVTAAGVSFTGKSRRRVFIVHLDDGSGPVQGVWFHFREKFLQQQFPIGARVLFAGNAVRMGRFVSFLHPDVERLDEDDDMAADQSHIAGRILPVYPSTAGVSQRLLRKVIASAWAQWGTQIPEWLPTDVRARFALQPLGASLGALHCPPDDADVAQLNAGETDVHHTLRRTEALLCALALGLRRHARAQQGAVAVPWDAAVTDALMQRAGFALTTAQQRVLRDIAGDLSGSAPMHRLIQGDVGSGKTIVAGIAAAQVAAAGAQVAFLAPTELLAQQHLRSLTPLLGDTPPALLTGATSARDRTAILEQLAAGACRCVVGTHALLESDVQFAALALVIIDEQHRFGVAQRMQLQRKGKMPHVLVLTATPIPRTLTMTIYGDLSVSVIDELPAGRKPIITKLYRETDRTRLLQGMRAELTRGRQVYVVYPLVEESEKLDVKNATAMAEQLRQHFAPDFAVGLLHGRMKPAEKDAVMQQFRDRAVHVLVSTTVIEVGVDVPNASVMVIEHAERFGLAQLHQLRGRVGRGAEQSYCILMASPRLSDDAYNRLSVLVRTTDGFVIAEEDLRIRGPGEVLGTRQSGLPNFRMLRLPDDLDVLTQSTRWASDILRDDPDLAQHPELHLAIQHHFGNKLSLAQVG